MRIIAGRPVASLPTRANLRRPRPAHRVLLAESIIRTAWYVIVVLAIYWLFNMKEKQES